MAGIRPSYVWTYRLASVAAVAGCVWCLADMAQAQPRIPLPPELTGEEIPKPQTTVAEIRVEGNSSITLDKIQPHLRLRVGRPFEFDAVENDVRALLATHMFVDVKSLYEQTPNGVIVTFRVIERPILQEIQYVGNQKVRTKTLEKETGLKVGDAVDPTMILEAKRRIEEFYERKGYNHARVVVLEGTQTTDRRAVFQIHEGPRQKIAQVDFTGNTIVSEERLRTIVMTKPVWFWRVGGAPYFWKFGGDFDPEKVDADIDKLMAYYHGLGYWGCRVGREVSYDQTGDDVRINFVIDEGPQFFVRDIAFVGYEKFSEADFRKDLKLKAGEAFNQGKLETDVNMVKDLYGGSGYIFADIQPDVRFLEEPAKLDIVYQITEGARYRVGRINVIVEGDYPHTKITTVLNRISLHPGDIVDIRELRASERRLKAAGVFRVDPSRGVSPKIVFGPPKIGPEDAQFAERGGRSARGQDPATSQPGWRFNPATRTWESIATAPPRAELPSGDQWIDVTMREEITPPQPTGEEEPGEADARHGVPAGYAVPPGTGVPAGYGISPGHGQPQAPHMQLPPERFAPPPRIAPHERFAPPERLPPPGYRPPEYAPPRGETQPAPPEYDPRLQSQVPSPAMIRPAAYHAPVASSPVALREVPAADEPRLLPVGGTQFSAAHDSPQLATGFDPVERSREIERAFYEEPAAADHGRRAPSHVEQLAWNDAPGAQPGPTTQPSVVTQPGLAAPAAPQAQTATATPPARLPLATRPAAEAPRRSIASRPVYATLPPVEQRAVVRGQDYGDGRALPTSPGTSAYGSPGFPSTYGPPGGSAPPPQPYAQGQPYQPPAYQPQPGFSPPAPTVQPGYNELPPPGAGPTGPGYEVVPPGQEPDGRLLEGPGEFDWTREPTQDFDVYVEETETGRLMFGVGVNSDAGVVGNVVIDEQNFDITRFPRGIEDFRNGTAFRGKGQRFRVELAPGNVVSRYVVSFTDPYIFDTPNSFGVSASYYERILRDWDEERTSGRVIIGRQITPDLSATFAVRGESVDISNPHVPTPPELERVLGQSSIVGFRGALIHDTRDSAFLPTEGHYLEFSFEQVVGDFSYPRGGVEARQFFLLHQRPDGSGRHTLALKGQFDITGTDTPIYDNYFAGGFTTIRGFSFRGASPRNMGAIVGGRMMFLASLEYLFPITADDMLRGVVFCDTGTVEQDIEINDYRVAPGFGLRINLAALGPAPIALDFAFPVVQAEGDDEQIFSFYVGATR